MAAFRPGPALEQFMLAEQQLNLLAGGITVHLHKHQAQGYKAEPKKYEHIAQFIQRYGFEVRWQVVAGEPFFGQDRIETLCWRLRKENLALS